MVRIDTGFAINRVSSAICADRRRCSESGDPASQKKIDALLVYLLIQTKSVYRPVSKSEIKRVREVYATRDSVMPLHDWKVNIYHPRHPMGRLFHEHNHSILVQALNNLDFDLGGRKVLGVGCGFGYWLRYCVELGSNPTDLVGVDVSEERIKEARTRNPAITWLKIDGSNIPLPSETFDLVMQVVVFSSIHDPSLREKLATEMWRTLRVGGHLLWLDHRLLHSDHLIGFTVSQVEGYFHGAELLYSRRVHPRYFRYIYNRFGWLAQLLSKISMWRSEAQLLIFEKVR